MQYNPFLELRLKNDRKFRVILENEFEYNQAREISNSFYDLKPLAVAYPRTAADVSTCIAYCKALNQPFRTRSGGHNHEGMSSQNGGLVIRMSDMSLIEYLSDNGSGDFAPDAWIGTGMKLGSVYAELAKLGLILPAGGCFTVNTGGLALGGGWGMHSRMHGLTCDSILAIELVKADGKVLEVTAENDPSLFKSLCGAGQGNFGIVTRIKFRLTRIGANQTSFRLGWRTENRKKAVEAWLNAQAKFSNELTTFVRLNVQEGDPDEKSNRIVRARDYPVYAGGLFYGSKQDLMKELEPWIKDIAPDCWDEIKEIKPKAKKKEVTDSAIKSEEVSIFDLFGYDDFSLDLPARTDRENTGDSNSESDDCLVPPPAVNCNIPHPHKVSSAFPKGADHAALAKVVDAYIRTSKPDPYVRSYMTFHAMGGAISKAPAGGRAFPYHDKEFLLQFQSWWNYPEKAGEACWQYIKDEEKKYISWVTDFREKLKDEELVEGAFINFIDKDLVKDISTLEGRLALLRYYYADNLPELRKVKQRVDPENKFNFEMSIPPL